jgi:hypothetical protein
MDKENCSPGLKAVNGTQCRVGLGPAIRPWQPTRLGRAHGTDGRALCVISERNAAVILELHRRRKPRDKRCASIYELWAPLHYT